jgi:hypothetical protein
MVKLQIKTLKTFMEKTPITIEDIKSTMQKMHRGDIKASKSCDLAVLIGGFWYPAQQLVTHTSLVCDAERWEYTPEEAVALLCKLTFIRTDYIEFDHGKPVPVKTSLAMLLSSQLKLMQDRLMVYW